MMFRLFISIVGVLTSAASAQAAETFRDCPDCPLMVTVSGGTFHMGASTSEFAGAVRAGEKAENVAPETPMHEVRVRKFRLGKTEVTRDEFSAFVRATGYLAANDCMTMLVAGVKPHDDWRNPGFKQDGTHPVVCVSWNDATAYVQWLAAKTGKSYRLPTEAEWEYAARAGTTSRRYFGDKDDDACLFENVGDLAAARSMNLDPDLFHFFRCNDGYANTAPVGRFKPNAFGLHDMLGNVSEFTQDCYQPSYRGSPSDGTAWRPADCKVHVVRGGSYSSEPMWLRASFRGSREPDYRTGFDGFRVARSD